MTKPMHIQIEEILDLARNYASEYLSMVVSDRTEENILRVDNEFRAAITLTLIEVRRDAYVRFHKEVITHRGACV